jgi:hypothetical protein
VQAGNPEFKPQSHQKEKKPVGEGVRKNNKNNNRGNKLDESTLDACMEIIQ